MLTSQWLIILLFLVNVHTQYNFYNIKIFAFIYPYILNRVCMIYYILCKTNILKEMNTELFISIFRLNLKFLEFIEINENQKSISTSSSFNSTILSF